MLICHAADVQAAERAGPAAQRQPPVDALPVEGVAARQAAYVLPVAEPRYAHAAAARVVVVVVATAADHAAGAGAGEGSGEERHHVPHRRHHLSIYLNQNSDADYI